MQASDRGPAWSVSALLIVVAGLPMLQGVLMTPLLAVIRDASGDHGSSTFLLRLIMAAPSLTVVALLPLLGRYADALARRHIFIFGLALYAICGVALYAQPQLHAMLASRLLLGVALACLMMSATALTGDLFAGAARDRILGRQYAFSAAVGLCVPVLAGLIALNDWRSPFLVYLVAALLIVPALALPRRSGAVGARPVAAGAFPLRPVLGIYALIGIGTAALWLLTIQLAFHLAGIGYHSPLVAGLALATPCLAGIVIGMLYAKVRQRFAFPVVAAAAFTLIGVGYAIIAATVDLPFIAVGLLLAGVGFGLNQPNCGAWLLAVVAPEFRGRSAAGLTVAICAGQIISPFLYQPMVALAGSAGAFGIMSAGCLATAAVVLTATGAATRAQAQAAAR